MGSAKHPDPNGSGCALGAFLSGGIDSSLIMALIQAQSARRVKIFTIGFTEAAYDEAQDAACIARHLGTEHMSFTFQVASA